MANGTVKFFNAAKGFGFITPEGEGKDVFVMAAAVTQSGMAGLKPGQRLSFETVPDTKGPKAVNLKLLAEAPVKAPQPPSQNGAPALQNNTRLTLYCDPGQEETDIVLEALAACGQEARMVDYIVTPPGRDQLKALSVLMRGSDQSLVRKYDPLFRELSLDDRFIGDNEFWTAIFEHPTLINGPILVLGSQARVCRTAHDVRAFLGLPVDAPVAKPKAISSRLAALVNGHAEPLPERTETKKIETAPAVPEREPAKEPVLPVKIKLAPRVRPAATPQAKAEPKPAPKPLAKPAKQAKPAAKPVKVAKAAKPAAKKAVPGKKAKGRK